MNDNNNDNEAWIEDDPADHGTYWGNKGLNQYELDILNEHADKHYKLFDDKIKNPRSVNKHLEYLRRVQNVYYDYYNNGLGNRIQEARRLKTDVVDLEIYSNGAGGYKLNEAALEQMINDAILDAHEEQKNNNWTI